MVILDRQLLDSRCRLAFISLYDDDAVCGPVSDTLNPVRILCTVKKFASMTYSVWHASSTHSHVHAPVNWSHFQLFTYFALLFLNCCLQLETLSWHISSKWTLHYLLLFLVLLNSILLGRLVRTAQVVSELVGRNCDASVIRGFRCVGHEHPSRILVLGLHDYSDVCTITLLSLLRNFALVKHLGSKLSNGVPSLSIH